MKEVKRERKEARMRTHRGQGGNGGDSGGVITAQIREKVLRFPISTL
jgi:hypothetical protein